ncbi:alanine racemase, partial [Myxococcota bacterium]|nr:alanine racemase [Myxococcota bacterium]
IALLKARGYNDLVKHACATSGAIRFPWAHFDMVRVGLGLYGLYPHTSLAAQLPLIPAISLVTRVVDVREHPRGATLGYGATYVVEREGFRVAILPLGYHDGLPWALSNRGVVMIHGKRAPMVGRVSMDSVMVDVSDIPEAVKGADALVFGAHGGYELRPEEVARDAGTIVYELLARIGPRVQRIFRH